MTTAAPNVILSSVQYSQAQARRNHPCQPRHRSLSVMKKILGLVVLSLCAISASAADLMASSTAPTVTQNIVVEGAACPGVGATGFSSTGLLLSCQSGVWRSPQAGSSGGYLLGRSHCGGGWSCVSANVKTGGCSCPSGSSASWNSYGFTGDYACITNTYQGYICN